MVDGSSRPRRRGGGAGAVLERADLPHRQRHLHAPGRSVGVRRQPAGARGAEPRGHGGAGQPRGRGASAHSGSELHHGDGGRRLRRHVEYRGHLRPAQGSRRARPRSVRDHGRSAPRGAAAPGDQRRARVAAGAGHRRRRWWRRAGAGRRDVRDAGAAARRAAARQRHAGAEGPEDSRPRGRGHVAAHGQARGVGAARSPQGRRSRRAGIGRGRSAAAARGRRSGDHLQRGGRAVRSAPAGRRPEPRLREGDRPAHRTVGSARKRAAREHRQLHPRRGGVRHPPPEPPAAGDGGRQHAPGDVTEHGAGAHLRGSGQARAGV